MHGTGLRSVLLQQCTIERSQPDLLFCAQSVSCEAVMNDGAGHRGWSTSSPLDAVEITVKTTPADSSAQSDLAAADFKIPFRHSGWARLREKTAAAFERAGIKRSRLIRFRACGSRCWVLRKPTNEEELALAVEHCHDRFCIPCARARAANLSAELLKLCEGKDLRFFTFTLKHSHAPLQSQLDRLTRSWRRLRGKRVWQSTQRGGVAVIELHRSKKDGLWHPHLHVISEGDFVSNAETSSAWKKVTGDSFIVDVRRLRDAKEACRYVAKYAAKGVALNGDYDVDVLVEAITALRSKRLVQCFGSWSHFKTTDKPAAETWERWCTLEELVLQAAAGVQTARDTLHQLSYRYNIPQMIERHTRSPAPPDVTPLPTE